MKLEIVHKPDGLFGGFWVEINYGNGIKGTVPLGIFHTREDAELFVRAKENAKPSEEYLKGWQEGTMTQFPGTVVRTSSDGDSLIVDVATPEGIVKYRVDGKNLAVEGTIVADQPQEGLVADTFVKVTEVVNGKVVSTYYPEQAKATEEEMKAKYDWEAFTFDYVAETKHDAQPEIRQFPVSKRMAVFHPDKPMRYFVVKDNAWVEVSKEEYEASESKEDDVQPDMIVERNG